MKECKGKKVIYRTCARRREKDKRDLRNQHKQVTLQENCRLDISVICVKSEPVSYSILFLVYQVLLEARVFARFEAHPLVESFGPLELSFAVLLL